MTLAETQWLILVFVALQDHSPICSPADCPHIHIQSFISIHCLTQLPLSSLYLSFPRNTSLITLSTVSVCDLTKTVNSLQLILYCQLPYRTGKGSLYMCSLLKMWYWTHSPWNPEIRNVIMDLAYINKYLQKGSFLTSKCVQVNNVITNILGRNGREWKFTSVLFSSHGDLRTS